MSLVDRLTISGAKAVLKNPSILHGYLRRGGCKANVAFDKRFQSRPETSIGDEDWDTLLILDACRYDMFGEMCSLEGDLSTYTSAGSTSKEFFLENFDGRQFHDTVYVTANPFVNSLPEETFHDVIHVYRTDWDEEKQTVTPAAMTEAVRDAHETYPDKRIVGHYMQPHYPFLGERGKNIDHRGYHPDGDGHAALAASIWRQVQFGVTDSSEKDVITAYYENLQLVLEYVEGLLEEIDGKIVVTADHGNLLGERMWPIPVRVYGHPSGSYAPELIEVPWFEPPFESRRKVRADAPVEDADSSDTMSESESKSKSKEVAERLEALGYR